MSRVTQGENPGLQELAAKLPGTINCMESHKFNCEEVPGDISGHGFDLLETIR